MATSRLNPRWARPLILATLASIGAGTAAAQSVANLEARVARLEAEQATARPAGSLTTATGIDLTFYGYVRGDFYFDSNYDMGPNTIGFGSITADSPENSKFGAHAYHTRLGVRGSAGEVKFNFEGDFYGGGGGGFRVRHAYAEYAGFTFGQTWTNMASLGPGLMLDINGTPSFPGHRAVQARYTFRPMENLTASVSVEDDIMPWKARPLLTGALLYHDGDNSYKVSALARSIDDLTGDTVTGWGLSTSTQMKLWEGGTVNAVVGLGEGVSSLMNGATGVGQQVGQTAVRGTYDLDSAGDPVGMKVYALGVNQVINPKLDVTASVGLNDYDDFAGSTPGSLDKLFGGFLTVRYRPAENLTLGLEYARFERKEFGGASQKNDRLLSVVQFNF